VRHGLDLVIIHGGVAGINQAFSVSCRGLGIVAEAHLADNGLTLTVGSEQPVSRPVTNIAAGLSLAPIIIDGAGDEPNSRPRRLIASSPCLYTTFRCDCATIVSVVPTIET
jgi:hypothetical protein